MKIYSDDGHEFKTVNECNAYEANQKLLKLKEEAERKEKEEKEPLKLGEINATYNKFIALLKNYEDDYNKLLYVTSNYKTGEREIKSIEIAPNNSSKYLSSDDFAKRILKAVREI